MFRLPPKERLGYAILVLAVLFGVGFYGTKAVKPPPQLTFETPPVPFRNPEAQPKVEIPDTSSVAEVPPQVQGESRPDPKGQVAKSATTEKPISLNSATELDLMTIPGIGPATAKKIVDYRRQNGGFKEIEELRAIRGLGAKKLEQIRPYLVP